MSDPRISAVSPRTLEPVSTEPEPTSCAAPPDAEAARRAELAHAESRMQSLADSPIQTRDTLRQQWIERRAALKNEKPIEHDPNGQALINLPMTLVSGGMHGFLGIAKHIVEHTIADHVLEHGAHLLEKEHPIEKRAEPTEAPVPPPATNGMRG